MRQVADFYNIAQRVASGISGYCPDYEPVAKNDYYYDECKTIEQKRQQVLDYADNAMDIDLEKHGSLDRVIEFLETESEMSSNDRYHAFHELH
jgi:hypothetical protein